MRSSFFSIWLPRRPCSLIESPVSHELAWEVCVDFTVCSLSGGVHNNHCWQFPGFFLVDESCCYDLIWFHLRFGWQSVLIGVSSSSARDAVFCRDLAGDLGCQFCLDFAVLWTSVGGDAVGCFDWLFCLACVVHAGRQCCLGCVMLFCCVFLWRSCWFLCVWLGCRRAALLLCYGRGATIVLCLSGRGTTSVLCLFSGPQGGCCYFVCGLVGLVHTPGACWLDVDE